MNSKNDSAFLVRSIGYFNALAHTLSYTKTAAELGISQPALTQQIKKLEDIVGTPLFYMEGKKIHLTHAGEVFLNATQKVTNIFTDANDEIKEVSFHKHDQINIGVISAMPANVLIDFIAKFKKKKPQVDFNVNSILQYSLRSQLEMDAVDILFTYLPDKSLSHLKQYKSVKLCRSELILASPYELKDGNKISLEEARKYRWVGYPEGYYLSRLISEEYHRQNIYAPDFAARFSQVANILFFAEKTNTIAAIPDICLPFLKDKEIYIYHFNPAIKFDVSLIYRKNKLKVSIIQEFLKEFELYLNKRNFITRLDELAGRK